MIRILLPALLLFLLPALTPAALIPPSWSGWKRDTSVFSEGRKGAMLDVIYQPDGAGPVLQVSLSTREKSIAKAARKQRSFENPNYVKAMAAMPGVRSMRTWKDGGFGFVCEAYEERNSELTIVHPGFACTFTQEGATEDELRTYLSRFDLQAMEIWSRTPFDPATADEPAPVIGCTVADGDDEHGTMAPRSVPVSPTPTFPDIEGWTKVVMATSPSDLAAAVEYRAPDGLIVDARISRVAEEVEGVGRMLAQFDASPDALEKSAAGGAFDLSLRNESDHAILRKFSKNVGAPKSSITVTNAKAVLHLSAPRGNDRRLEEVLATFDLAVLLASPRVIDDAVVDEGTTDTEFDATRDAATNTAIDPELTDEPHDLAGDGEEAAAAPKGLPALFPTLEGVGRKELATTPPEGATVFEYTLPSGCTVTARLSTAPTELRSLHSMLQALEKFPPEKLAVLGGDKQDVSLEHRAGFIVVRKTARSGKKAGTTATACNGSLVVFLNGPAESTELQETLLRAFDFERLATAHPAP